jgi:hypothetical protein
LYWLIVIVSRRNFFVIFCVADSVSRVGSEASAFGDARHPPSEPDLNLSIHPALRFYTTPPSPIGKPSTVE